MGSLQYGLKNMKLKGLNFLCVLQKMVSTNLGFPCSASGKEPTCNAGYIVRHRFDPWVGKIPWNTK